MALGFAFRIVLAVAVALATAGAPARPLTASSGDGTGHLESSAFVWASPSGRTEIQRWRADAGRSGVDALTRLPAGEPVRWAAAFVVLDGVRTDLLAFAAPVVSRHRTLERSRGPPV